ncbi:FAD-dependent oxidoreductase [Phenylobacterium sp. J367]|nr:FAD-binding protein [Phenylobacterium sp. J367]MCR5879570.1 FAD-dependent oxidoreductase [Phenylobacterium sp. J367]
MEDFDVTVDVVVVGAGAGGMVSAWTAAQLGLEAVIIEKAGVYGGNSALSGGGAWLPNAPFFQRLGEGDDPEHLFRYLQTIAPNVKPERHRRYIAEAPRLAAAMETTPYYQGGKGFLWIKGYADYHPKLGGNPKGRGLWPQPIDERVLGEDMTTRRGHGRAGRLAGTPPGMWMTSADLHDLMTLRWGTLRGPLMLLRLGWRSLVANLLGWKMITSGAALITRLRLMLRDEGVPVWLNTPMRRLIQDDAGNVVGVQAERGGRTYRIRARHGVVMAAGGFEGSKEKRALYQPDAIHAGTQGSPDNTGDWIAPATEVGAALDLMDDAWWMPALSFLPGQALGMVPERQYPHQFIVNGDGKRYVNESCPYTDFGHRMIEGHRTGVRHFPSHMILDQFAWDHYFFRGLPGRPMPKEWLTSGMVKKANSIGELARLIGVPPGEPRGHHGAVQPVRPRGSGRGLPPRRGRLQQLLRQPEVQEPEPGRGEARAVLRLHRGAQRSRHQGRHAHGRERARPSCRRVADRRALCSGQQQRRGDGQQLRGAWGDPGPGHDVRLDRRPRHR